MCNSTFKCIPNNLKLLLPHDSFHLVLMVSVLYFFFPIQTTLVLSKFILRPDYFAQLDSTLRVSFKEVNEPSNITDVSSAYCDNMYSVLLIVIPLIFLLFLILIARTSAHSTNRQVDTGSPCRQPLPM